MKASAVASRAVPQPPPTHFFCRKVQNTSCHQCHYRPITCEFGVCFAPAPPRPPPKLSVSRWVICVKTTASFYSCSPACLRICNVQPVCFKDILTIDNRACCSEIDLKHIYIIPTKHRCYRSEGGLLYQTVRIIQREQRGRPNPDGPLQEVSRIKSRSDKQKNRDSPMIGQKLQSGVHHNVREPRCKGLC